MSIKNTWLMCAGLSFYVEYDIESNDEGEHFVELLKVTLENSPHDLIDVLTDYVLQSLETQVTYL